VFLRPLAGFGDRFAARREGKGRGGDGSRGKERERRKGERRGR